MNGPSYGFGGGASLHTPATRASAAPGDAQGTGPAPEAGTGGAETAAGLTAPRDVKVPYHLLGIFTRKYLGRDLLEVKPDERTGIRAALAEIIPAIEAVVRYKVADERDARIANPALIAYGTTCRECNETFEADDQVTWRWEARPYGLIHDECRFDYDKPPMTENEIRADERAKVVAEIEAMWAFPADTAYAKGLRDACQVARQKPTYNEPIRGEA